MKKSEKQNNEYLAFISYQRRDEALAKKLQHTLEYYKLPVAVIEKEPSLKEGVRPIFVDMTELGDEPFLKPAIESALDSSRFLIVICSPKSAQSKWVNKEVQYFAKLKRTKRIIPFIVEGNPNSVDKDTECCTPMLKKLLGQRELLGININEMGFDAAAVKVVSRMFHVKFSSLWNRYEKEKEEEQRKLKEEKEKLQIVQSRFLAEKANQLVDEGDSYLARLLALKALPKDLKNPDRPYVAEAEAALRNSVMHETAILKGHHHDVKYAIVSAGGDYILSVDNERTVRIWNIHNGVCEKEYPDIADEASFLPKLGDNIFAVITKWACKKDNLQIFDLTQNDIIRKIHINKFYLYCDRYICFSSDGELLFTIKKEALNIWNVRNGTLGRTIQNDRFKTTCCFAVAPDNGKIVCGFSDGSISIIDVETEEVLITYQRQGKSWPVDCVAFNVDGSRIVSSSWKTINLWDSSDSFIKQHRGNIVITNSLKDFDLNNHETILSLAFSNDDQEIVSASRDHTVKVWDIESGECETLKGHFKDVNNTIFSPLNPLIISASSDKTIRIWEHGLMPNFKIIPLNPSVVGQPCAFSPDCLYIAIANHNNVNLWDTKNRRTEKTFEGHSKHITSIDYSPSGNMLLVCTNENSARIWNIINSEWRDFDDQHCIDVAAFNSNGNKIVTADSHIIKIWDVESIWNEKTPKPIKTLKCDEEVRTAKFSPDDSTLIVFDYIGNLYEYALQETEFREVGHNKVYDGYFNGNMIITPDGKRILYIAGEGQNDRSIHVWDRVNKEQRKSLEGHKEPVTAISLNEDGSLLVSTSEDYTVKIWDVESGGCIKTFTGHTKKVYNVAFSHDNRHVFSVSRDNTIIKWDFPPLQELINDTHTRFKDRELTPEEKKKYYLE